MRFLSRPISRCFTLAAAALLIGSSAAPSPTIAATPADAEHDSVAALHEARLRKLHLVRPDLISYPLLFDVIC